MPVSADRPTGPFGTLRVERSSTVDRVVTELRRALFDGEIEPGTPLREVALADALGVARSTVREALAALVADGLVTREPNRGVQVATLAPDAVLDVCRARTVLETAGLRRWAEASPAARDRVREAVTAFTALAAAHPSPPADAVTSAHLAVHRSLVALTESPRLVAHADGLFAEVRLALARVDRDRRDLADQAAAHAELLARLERGEADAVADHLRHHLEAGAASMLQTLGG